MDPVSMTAGLVAVTQQLLRIQKTFASRNDKWGAIVQDAMADIPVYIDILNEMYSTMVAFRGTMPPAAQSCLGLCYGRALRIANLMSKGEQTPATGPKDKIALAPLEHALQQFKQSVSLLRDIIMDGMTHQLLRNQQHELAQLYSDRPGTITPSQGRKSPLDPTAFDATIFCGIGDGPQWIAGRGILDSGCDDNWISLDIVNRANITNGIVQATQKKRYTGFGGQTIEAKGSIDITWYANNASKTRQTGFLVAEHGPFDLLLGKHFIFSENIFMFNQAALVLKAAPITEAERLQMEAIAVQTRASNDEIEAIRRAGEASARNQYREQNASFYPESNSNISGSSSRGSTQFSSKTNLFAE
ncbi:MAG: hypothetical protein Q9191_002853 [Dirinaria sp. TL-2023a]